ncbi:hypothetical protein EMWEY_00033530 [Eimeria maxima]|uniref:Uncharacterized protein n=1 Tax=Eimeria maxima TaxID=5804 RepID=U6MG98_EIMMA|nr:hypothetical protein EMWEY_00033530 [Eimeria maxima]CDJ60670.1 hypothetical protein EMWEY_00033530 [Eimeria maxima]
MREAQESLLSCGDDEKKDRQGRNAAEGIRILPKVLFEPAPPRPKIISSSSSFSTTASTVEEKDRGNPRESATANGNGSVAEERTVYASAGTGSDSIIPLKTGQRAIGEGADSSMGEHDNRQGDTVKIRRVGRRSGSQEVEKDGCINEAQKDTPYQTEQGQNEQGLHRAGAEFSKQLSAASVQYYDGQARRKTEATQGTQPGHATTPASCNFVWNGNARSNSRLSHLLRDGGLCTTMNGNDAFHVDNLD